MHFLEKMAHFFPQNRLAQKQKIIIIIIIIIEKTKFLSNKYSYFDVSTGKVPNWN